MKARTIEHFLQRDILRHLSKSEGMRFTELKPGMIENNIFMYHMHQLMQWSLVEKHEKLYRLTSEGMRHVALVTRGQLEQRIQPKLFSFLILRNDLGEVVLHRRAGQPFIGRFTFPGEVIYFNDDTDDHMRRLLKDKVNLRVPLKLRGLADTRLMRESEVITHTYAQLLYGDVKGRPELRSIDTNFTPQWIDINKIAPNEILPDVPEILEKIVQSDEYFYLSLIKNIESLPPKI
jgi:ADP-ribose pyrophosphatase YjhB (NUDIX family)